MYLIKIIVTALFNFFLFYFFVFSLRGDETISPFSRTAVYDNKMLNQWQQKLMVFFGFVFFISIQIQKKYYKTRLWKYGIISVFFLFCFVGGGGIKPEPPCVGTVQTSDSFGPRPLGFNFFVCFLGFGFKRMKSKCKTRRARARGSTKPSKIVFASWLQARSLQDVCMCTRRVLSLWVSGRACLLRVHVCSGFCFWWTRRIKKNKTKQCILLGHRMTSVSSSRSQASTWRDLYWVFQLSSRVNWFSFIW